MVLAPRHFFVGVPPANTAPDGASPRMNARDLPGNQYCMKLHPFLVLLVTACGESNDTECEDCSSGSCSYYTAVPPDDVSGRVSYVGQITRAPSRWLALACDGQAGTIGQSTATGNVDVDPADGFAHPCNHGFLAKQAATCVTDACKEWETIAQASRMDGFVQMSEDRKTVNLRVNLEFDESPEGPAHSRLLCATNIPAPGAQ